MASLQVTGIAEGIFGRPYCSKAPHSNHLSEDNVISSRRLRATGIPRCLNKSRCRSMKKTSTSKDGIIRSIFSAFSVRSPIIQIVSMVLAAVGLFGESIAKQRSWRPIASIDTNNSHCVGQIPEALDDALANDRTNAGHQHRNRRVLSVIHWTSMGPNHSHGRNVESWQCPQPC